MGHDLRDRGAPASAILGDHLKDRFPSLSRAERNRLLKFGSVLVNGRVETQFHRRLDAGDRVEILSKKQAFTERVRRELRLTVLYEDDVMLVTDKPAGLLTMATERQEERTLYRYATAYVRAKSDDGKGRVFIVHRLDRDTSGVVVFAKSEGAKEALQASWPDTVKIYRAVLEGAPPKDQGLFKSFLADDRDRRVRSVGKRDVGAKEAMTRYRVLSSGGGYTLVEIDLLTGRKNQIRVHMAEAGCPVAGDRKYGAESDPIGRLVLHAVTVDLDHPVTGNRMHFESPMPDEFSRIIS